MEMITFAGYRTNTQHCMKDTSLVLQFADILANKGPFLITAHSNPDGDAIGSSLAWMHYLRQKGMEVHVVIPNMYPNFLSWCPGVDEIIIFDQQAALAKTKIAEAKLIFCLDYNAINRSGVLQEDLQKSDVPRVLIDHHPEPATEQFNYFYYDTTKSSTAELIFNLINDLDDKQLINKNIAENIFVGLMTDTGSFSHSINDAATFRTVAELLDVGIDAEWIHRQVYDTFSENRLRLLGHAITNRMIVLEEYNTAIIHLSKEDLADYRFQIGDTEGIVNYPLSMKKINLSVLITEKKDLVRLSFRSKGSFSVNDLARKHFDGGGHDNAAGGNSNQSLKETVTRFLGVLPDYKEMLNY
jgi:bifunctional oligoribonuclease and PAP phosphatase NrnA